MLSFCFTMSNPAQRMRKNISPGAGTKQGPIKATVPLSLMHQNSSPTKYLIDSPSKTSPVSWSGENQRTKSKLTPENRISPEIHFSPNKGEKSKNAPSKVSPGPYIRRTASVDTIYLLGQWQRDALYLSYCGRLMVDRATQTPDDLAEDKLQKNCSEALEMKFICQRIQRTSHSPRLVGSPSSSLQRQSPDISCPPSSPTVPSTSPLQIGSTCPSSPGAAQALPIPIPDIPKPLIPRMRNSVEGLNQRWELTPEGHRAPIADLFRRTHSVDTQTPLDGCSTGSSSGSHSISPAAPILLDSSRPSSTDSKGNTSSPDSTHPSAASPHINKFLAREPPDGCEKVKIAEESRNLSYEIPESNCPKPSVNFVLLPSRRSAFYPLCKNCGFSAPNGDIVNSGTPPSSEGF